jgi:hypothetical protein
MQLDHAFLIVSVVLLLLFINSEAERATLSKRRSHQAAQMTELTKRLITDWGENEEDQRSQSKDARQINAIG